MALRGPGSPEAFPLSADARRVLALAQEEAAQRGYPSAGTEELLLALLRLEGGPARETLRGFGITRERALRVLNVFTGPREGPDAPPRAGPPAAPGGSGFTNMLEEALEFAAREAGPDGPVRPEHLLLALAHLDGSVGGASLRLMGGVPERVRQALADAVRAAPLSAEATALVAAVAGTIHEALPRLPLSAEDAAQAAAELAVLAAYAAAPRPRLAGIRESLHMLRTLLAAVTDDPTAAGLLRALDDTLSAVGG
jgi:ATP-dependent Clp protease ATP-binding subunit ClpA